MYSSHLTPISRITIKSNHFRVYSPEAAAPNLLGIPMLPTLLELVPGLLVLPLLTVLPLPLPTAEDLLLLVFLFLALPLPFPPLLRDLTLELLGSAALALASSCSWSCLAVAMDFRYSILCSWKSLVVPNMTEPYCSTLYSVM